MSKAKYKKGDYVAVVAHGKIYPRYIQMAEALRATKWTGEDWIEYRGVGIVVNHRMHITQPGLGRIYLIDIGSKEILIGEKGIQKINKLVYALRQEGGM